MNRRFDIFLLIVYVSIGGYDAAYINCPTTADGIALTCEYKCCPSIINGELAANNGYYCCDSENGRQPHLTDDGDNSIGRVRQQRFVTYTNGVVRIDYTLLLIAVIVSIVISVILSLVCCLFCECCQMCCCYYR